MDKIKVSSKGQITLPSRVRDAMDIEYGDSLIVDTQDNKIILEIPKYKTLDEFLNSIEPSTPYITNKMRHQIKLARAKRRYERSLH